MTDWFWEQVWGELHHQGDVGEASYAVLPYFVEYSNRTRQLEPQLVAYACVVEECRRNEYDQGNPPVPPEVLPSYQAALSELPLVALSLPQQAWNENMVQYIASLIALTHDQFSLAKAYQDFTGEEATKWLAAYYG